MGCRVPGAADFARGQLAQAGWTVNSVLTGRSTRICGKAQRVLLHFGAVDWHASVFVNGKKAGEHKGGYTPFSFDITPLLGADKQELVVSVTDPSSKQYQICW